MSYVGLRFRSIWRQQRSDPVSESETTRRSTRPKRRKTVFTVLELQQAIKDMETGERVFDGELSTPNKELSVCNVLNEKLLTLPVPQASTRVKVFANGPSEPDQIVFFAK